MHHKANTVQGFCKNLPGGDGLGLFSVLFHLFEEIREPSVDSRGLLPHFRHFEVVQIPSVRVDTLLCLVVVIPICYIPMIGARFGLAFV